MRRKRRQNFSTDLSSRKQDKQSKRNEGEAKKDWPFK